MASTIQLKTGTGSAVPSSLTQGEVAINIDNGLFYYGSGSTNTKKQLENFTNITASGDISSSGNIIADYYNAKTSGTGYKLSGTKALWIQQGTVLGRLGGYDTKITGSSIILGQEATTHITTSGDISGSSNLYSGRFFQGGTNISSLYAPIEGGTGITTVGDIETGNVTAVLPFASTAATTTGTSTTTIVTPDGLRDHTFANINSTGIISASGIDLSNNVSSSGLYMPSSNPTNATTAVNSLLYVSSSTNITGSRTDNNLMYSGSVISAPLGTIHMKHGHFKLPNTSAANDMTYCSWGTGDKENTTVTNAYVSFFAPYSGRIRKFSAAANVGSFNHTQFHYLIANSLVAACSGNLATGNTLYDIDWGGSAVFNKGDELQIGVQSNTVGGNASLYWTCVFEFNVD